MFDQNIAHENTIPAAINMPPIHESMFCVSLSSIWASAQTTITPPPIRKKAAQAANWSSKPLIHICAIVGSKVIAATKRKASLSIGIIPHCFSRPLAKVINYCAVKGWYPTFNRKSDCNENNANNNTAKRAHCKSCEYIDIHNIRPKIKPILTHSLNYGNLRVQVEKGLVGIGVLLDTRRSKAALFSAAFSMVGRSGPRKRAVPCSGNANPVRPATSDWRHCGWVFEPTTRRAAI